MSEFKDMIQEDIKNVFLDLEMFGETHIVAGKERTIILDDGEKLRRSELYQDSKGIYNKQIFFYIAAEDLARKPEIGQVMRHGAISSPGTEYSETLSFLW